MKLSGGLYTQELQLVELRPAEQSEHPLNEADHTDSHTVTLTIHSQDLSELQAQGLDSIILGRALVRGVNLELLMRSYQKDKDNFRMWEKPLPPWNMEVLHWALDRIISRDLNHLMQLHVEGQHAFSDAEINVLRHFGVPLPTFTDGLHYLHSIYGSNHRPANTP